ncbi:poly-ribose polymerase-like protein [Apodospora peruviana]|uniref:Poly [ADP-ribose] polymerase n=1 Tax=Apodospora peruviana TaxID=516989 RepID=A0AAE0IIR7_9PEZI|nr:poly-ribose polymerase-like protein [Apodospora peruviana]
MPPRKGKKANTPAPPPLEGCKIAFSGQFPGETHASLKATAEGAGATVASSVTKDTTHLVATEADFNKTAAKVVKAQSSSIPIVSLEWLTLSAKNNIREPEKHFMFGAADEDDDDDVAQAAASNSASQADGTATNGRKSSRKRAASPAANDNITDNDNAPPAKKTRGCKAAPKSDDANGTEAKDDDDDKNVKDAKVKTAKPKKKSSSPAPIMGEGQIIKRKDIQIPLDEGCPWNTSAVYIDDSGIVYDASLNQTNASNNNNKFYRIQLLVDSSGTYRTWTRWGRVGERGQTATVGEGSLDGAMRQFEKKFRDKSGLSWAQRGDNPKPGKYAFVERSYTVDSDEEDDDDEKAVAIRGKKADDWKPPTCTLHPAVQRLMQLIFNQQFFNATMTSLNYDANKLPLGKLSKATITRGFQALKDLSNLLDDNSLAATKYSVPFATAVEQLSNSFYSLVPHAFGRNRPPVISDQQMVKKEVELMESLSDMKDAALIMKMDQVGDDNVHPLDKQYQGLKMEEMTPLDPTSAEFKHLLDYLMNTRGSTHVANYQIEAIFRIERQGEFDRFKQSPYAKTPKNRRLLWHGSRATNFGGILSQGLRIAPPEAPVNGYMFDKGIYLADMSSKSAGYCCPHISDRTALLLLCEAELGDPIQELTGASYNAASTAKANGMISTWGKGQTGPLKWKDAKCVNPALAGVSMPDTTVAPGDTKVPNAYLQYNEYICYDVAQVCLRYLFRVKM